MAQKGFKQEKKPTAAQLERRLTNAVMHIDRTSKTREIYFSDKGLRLVDCEEHVLVQTGFHTHVFSKVTSSGYSRPALYVRIRLSITLLHTFHGGLKSFLLLYTQLMKMPRHNSTYISSISIILLHSTYSCLSTRTVSRTSSSSSTVTRL